MPLDYQSVTLTPSSGGDLITRASHENVGPGNYVIKRDWRRDVDVEMRREGDVLFYPNTTLPIADQPYPAIGEPITLVHSARAANGKTAIIIGTQTRLFRYFALEGGPVYALTGPDTPVFAITGPNTPVYEDNPGGWLTIGTGFSTQGHRWEAKNVAGVVVFNNGVDLPVSYDLNRDFYVQPIKEIREQGIAYVGTIEEYNGFLMLADIGEIVPELLPAVFTGVDSGAVTASQNGLSILASAPFFTSAMVGQTITWDDGSAATIASFVSSTVVTAVLPQIIDAQTFRVAVAYGRYADSGNVSRVQYRIVWSDLGNPINFASSGVASITAGQTLVTLTYPLQSISPGDVVVVPGAGASGSALIATVLLVSDAGTSFQLDTPASTTVTDAAIVKQAGLSSLASSVDLQDDSSGIIRMVELQGRLVVLKDTSIFVGQYTGVAGQLFSFQRTYAGPKTLFWKWMVERVNGQALVFAGRNNFYTFDLSSQVPREHQKLTLCQNIFFDIPANSSPIDACYSTVNAVTSEVWFVFPSATADKGICYDYLMDTCSTIGVAYTAASTVKKPVIGVQTGPSEDWFVSGTSNGTVVQYGRTNFDFAVWSRRNANYDSTIKSGLVSFGNDFDEKDWRSYVLYLGTFSGNPKIEVTGYETRNAYETPTLKFTRDLLTPGTRNLIPVFYRNNYFQDQVRVTGTPTEVRIARRTYEASGVQSKSVNRNS